MKTSKYNLFIPKKEGNEFILFNTFTGHSFIVDEDIKTILENNYLDKLSEELKDEYYKKRIIIDENIDENRYFEYFHNKTKFAHDTLSITVLLTWACNLKCIYCYEGAGSVLNKSMTEETADRVISFIKNQAEIRNVKNISINLFGGEPLVNFNIGKKILQEVSEYCKENNKNLNSGIITNGTLITDEIIDELKRYNCKTVQITLDGRKEIHDNRRMYKNDTGSYDDVIKGIKLILNRKDFINPLIRINVDKTNLKDTYELLKDLREQQLTDCRVDFGIVRGETEACASYASNCFCEEELGEVLESLWTAARNVGFKLNTRPSQKWIFCGLNGDYTFTIAPTADVYKCWEQVGENEHIIGNLDESGQMINISYTFYDWMTRNPLQIDGCKECVYLPACGGGCGAISYNNSKSYHKEGCFKVKGTLERQTRLYFEEKYEKDVKCVEGNL